MKKKILIYIAIANILSLNGFAQIVQLDTSVKKKADNQINARTGTMTSSVKTVKTVKTVKSYHVVETINLTFGGHTTTYDVPDPKLINTFDLGPNNTRVITVIDKIVEQNTQVVTPVEPQLKQETKETTPVKTPIKEETKEAIPIEPLVKQETAIAAPVETKVESVGSIGSKNIDPLRDRLKINTHIDSPKKMGDYAYIDIVKTYERVTEKGYKSIFMLKKVCNAYFFNDEFEKAAKCYAELFALTTDVEPEYYYRYAISLKAIGEDKKASENLKKYNELSGNRIK
ncbi:tetratricopeptide repeat protein [Flavobacterium aestivum]|uniref:tetratricopeptide repeat protein n=1 Tax=Flavobacterium aestivum TaxID=3003257 RepID=UPI0024831B31|nr:hypothetical protein [Flavobacterium aestivum]